MKNRYKLIALSACGLAMSALSGCIEETMPTYNATSEQIAKASTALESIVSSLTNFTIATNTYGASYYPDAGWPGIMIGLDALCEDVPVLGSDTYDYYKFNADGSGTTWANYPYYYYYVFTDKINDVLRGLSAESLEIETNRNLIGNLYGFRAANYFNMARMWEYKETGYTDLDDKALADGIYGQTVPLMDEREMSVADIINNPRSPFQTMYRFIYTDLNKAESYLKGFKRSKVSLIDESVIWGLKARFFLELATRFDQSAADLATQLAAEGSEDGFDDLKITSAADCYKLAIEYADKVITSGYTPMSYDEWHDPVTGFNTHNNAWVWGSYITSTAERQSRWYAFFTWMNSEASWAWGGGYNCYRGISKALYDQIPDNDWRKISWVSPDDAGTEANSAKYNTNTTIFAKIPAYGNLKFHVRDLSGYEPGLVGNIPWMRVEEMYLIKAEAMAHTQGYAAANTYLESFVNTYRWYADADEKYETGAFDLNTFMDALMVQKRIELWGEGLVYFDYKRLKLGITRAYTGTNFLSNYRMNTSAGYVAPWMNCYFGTYATSSKDPSFKGNPNFSGVVKTTSI